MLLVYAFLLWCAAIAGACAARGDWASAWLVTVALCYMMSMHVHRHAIWQRLGPLRSVAVYIAVLALPFLFGCAEQTTPPKVRCIVTCTTGEPQRAEAVVPSRECYVTTNILEMSTFIRVGDRRWRREYNAPCTCEERP